MDLTAVCRSAHLVAPMAKARYFEIGVACLEIIAVLLAILVAVYVSPAFSCSSCSSWD